MADTAAVELRRHAARVLSVALGETAAPWADVCGDATACEHTTCNAVRALVAADLLCDGKASPPATHHDWAHRHHVTGAGAEHPHAHYPDGTAAGVPPEGDHRHPRYRTPGGNRG